MDHRKVSRSHNASYPTSPVHYTARRTTNTGRVAMPVSTISDIHTANSSAFIGEHHIGKMAVYNEEAANCNAVAPPSEMRYRQFPSTYGGDTGSINDSSRVAQHASLRHSSPHKSGFKAADKNCTTTDITTAGRGGDSDKGLVFHNGSMTYSHAAPGASQMFPPPAANPVVQTDNRLTEDYSRRIHCYISGDQEDDSIPNDHIPPPVLPPLQSLRGDQNMPFWRPPRVLQQDPHYNHAYSPMSTRTNIRHSPLVSHRSVEPCTDKTDYLRLHSSRKGTMDSTNSASTSNSMSLDGTSSLLSPALLAISNSHYEQQRRQYRENQRPGNITSSKHTTSGSTLPSIHALTEGISPDASTARPTSTYRSRDGLYTRASDRSAYKRERGEFGDLVYTSGDGEKGTNGYGAHLPPIYSKYRRLKDGHGLLIESAGAVASEDTFTSEMCGPSSAPNTPAFGGTRESISIPCLVDYQKPAPTRECSADTHQQHNATTSAAPAPSLSGYGSGTGSLASSASQLASRKRSYGATDAAMSLHNLARTAPELSLGPSTGSSGHPVTAADDLSVDLPQRQSLCAGNEVVITCYHASVAQKSYGGEKRFLCPPPAVLLCGDGYSAEIAHHSPMLLSVAPNTDTHGRLSPSRLPLRGGANGGDQQEGAQNTDSSNGGSGNSVRPSSSSHAPLECQTSFNERNVALFKSLHVTGMQKAKSFRLQLDLLIPTTVGIQLYPHDSNRWHAPDVYASLESDPVSIISKPSKKTAKARNQSSCIRAGSLISLFNRINSQTFRTKYLNVDHNTNRWVAQSHNWSPLEVVVLSDNGDCGRNETTGNSRGSDQAQPMDRRPLFYGSEIVLVESRRNFQSPPMIIHKVERGRLVENARSPVSQMQKIALQLKPPVSGSSMQFLKADVGHYSPVVTEGGSNMHFDDPDGSPELTFEGLENARISRTRARDTKSDDGGAEIDDAFCWTIVGISGFTYSYSIPSERPVPLRYISPIPRVTDISMTGEGKLVMDVQNFDSAQMQLMLNKTTLCSGAVQENTALTQGNRNIPQQQQQRQAPTNVALSKSGASTKKPEVEPEKKAEDSTIYTFQLPSDAQPGVLSIRRSDGVSYHTKWELKLNPTSNTLEAVACMLDI
ncbi:hypothetical protein IW140_003991 [Coemansia sp. RSA 1813]|nr:hypothetical protein LPJ74_002596 [Coemansia sp. RSA 1843]KAJ2088506.1 hypothetical protein IW138_004194 [Coemansia sp. RSA 986]KAJ2568263.1 hypothetical protein IW140_003991 [Coemansia sp. RSA 1813]